MVSSLNEEELRASLKGATSRKADSPRHSLTSNLRSQKSIRASKVEDPIVEESEQASRTSCEGSPKRGSRTSNGSNKSKASHASKASGNDNEENSALKKDDGDGEEEDENRSYRSSKSNRSNRKEAEKGNEDGGSFKDVHLEGQDDDQGQLGDGGEVEEQQSHNSSNNGSKTSQQAALNNNSNDNDDGNHSQQAALATRASQGSRASQQQQQQQQQQQRQSTSSGASQQQQQQRQSTSSKASQQQPDTRRSLDSTDSKMLQPSPDDVSSHASRTSRRSQTRSRLLPEVGSEKDRDEGGRGEEEEGEGTQQGHEEGGEVGGDEEDVASRVSKVSQVSKTSGASRQSHTSKKSRHSQQGSMLLQGNASNNPQSMSFVGCQDAGSASPRLGSPDQAMRVGQVLSALKSKSGTANLEVRTDDEEEEASQVISAVANGALLSSPPPNGELEAAGQPPLPPPVLKEVVVDANDPDQVKAFRWEFARHRGGKEHDFGAWVRQVGRFGPKGHDLIPGDRLVRIDDTDVRHLTESEVKLIWKNAQEVTERYLRLLFEPANSRVSAFE